MTSEQLGAVAGVALSLLFSYVPGLRDKFGELDSTRKSLAMAAMLLVVSLGALGLSCASVVNVIECSQSGVVQLVSVFISALVANQATYVLSPQVKPSA
jgi:hypothetical protein